jgi:hypothetical protein
MKIAILDDYQNVALTMADWSRAEGNSEITVSPTVPWNQTPWSRGFRPWPWPLVFLVGF